MATYHWLTAMGTLPMAKPRCWESLKAESDLKNALDRFVAINYLRLRIHPCKKR